MSCSLPVELHRTAKELNLSWSEALCIGLKHLILNSAVDEHTKVVHETDKTKLMKAQKALITMQERITELNDVLEKKRN